MDELFNNADETMIQGIKLFQELIHEDNTSLLFYSEVEKSITKATLEEKFTTALERLKQWKRTAQMQQRKKNPRKENSKSHMQKRKNKTTVIRSHIEENFRQKLKW